MSEPVEELCKAVNQLSENAQQEIVGIWCTALGWPSNVAELSRNPELADLRQRLNLVTGMRVLESMLIPGLLQYALDFFRAASFSGATSAAIDHDLSYLHKLEVLKTQPIAERPTGFTDKLVDHWILRVKAAMKQRASHRDFAKDVALSLEKIRKTIFTTEYWQEWSKSMAEAA